MMSDLSHRIRTMESADEFDQLAARIFDEEPSLYKLRLAQLHDRRNALLSNGSDTALDAWLSQLFLNLRADVGTDGFRLKSFNDELADGPRSPWQRASAETFRGYLAYAKKEGLHPVARALVLTALWDLKKYWQADKEMCKPVELARAAVTANVEAAVWMFAQKVQAAEMYAVQFWQSAIRPAYTINQPELLLPALPQMRSVIDELVLKAAAWALSLVRAELLLALVRRTRRSDLVPEERLTQLLSTLDRIGVELASKDVHWIEAEALEVRAQIEGLLGRAPNDQEVQRRLASLCEAQARRAKSKLMAAMRWKYAAQFYLQAGMRSEAEAALIQSRASVKEMETNGESKPITFTIEVPWDDQEKMVEPFFQGAESAIQIIERLGHRLLAPMIEQPPDKDPRAGFIAHHLMTTIPISGDRVGAELAPSSGEQASFLDSHDAVTELRLVSDIVLGRAFYRLKTEWDLAEDDLLGYLVSSPFVAGDDLPFLRSAVGRYLAGDLVATIHVIVPRIEQMIRRILQAAGVSITAVKDNEVRERYLGDLIRSGEKDGVLPPAIAKLLRLVLSDENGLNLRNRVAHGWLTPKECDQSTVDRVLHIALILASLRLASDQENAKHE